MPLVFLVKILADMIMLTPFQYKQQSWRHPVPFHDTEKSRADQASIDTMVGTQIKLLKRKVCPCLAFTKYGFNFTSPQSIQSPPKVLQVEMIICILQWGTKPDVGRPLTGDFRGYVLFTTSHGSLLWDLLLHHKMRPLGYISGSQSYSWIISEI